MKIALFSCFSRKFVFQVEVSREGDDNDSVIGTFYQTLSSTVVRVCLCLCVVRESVYVCVCVCVCVCLGKLYQQPSN